LDAVIAGWGIFIAIIAHCPFEEKEWWVWSSIGAVLVVRLVIDTDISVNYRVGINMVVNVSFVWFALLPLMFTRRNFVKSATMQGICARN